MNKNTLPVPALALVCVALLAGCKNPFASDSGDYGRRLSLRKMHSADVLPLDAYAQPGDVDEDAKAFTSKPPADRFVGMESFDLSIEQARSWALGNNFDIQVALIQPTIANERVSEEEAAFESVFDLSVRRTETDQPTTTTLVGSQFELTDIQAGVTIPMRTGGSITVQLPYNETKTNNPFTFLNPAVTTDLTVSISQPLLRGAGRRANTNQIRIAALQEGVALTRAKLEVIRQVAAADRAYWGLYAARAALEVSQSQYELAVSQLERSRRLQKAGKAPEIETIRSEEGVARRLEAIITSQNDVLVQQRELKRIMNAPGLDVRSEIIIIPTSPPDPVRYELDPYEIVEAAVENRMEMLELELQFAIDDTTIAFQKNQALPLFTLDYRYNLNGLGSSFSEAFSQARRGDFADWSLGLNAQVPIGNEAAKSRVEQAILTRVQRLSTREARRLSIEQEALNAIDSLNAGWQRILAARQSSILAGRTLATEERRFDVGLSTSTFVLDAATRLAESQLAEIRALRDYQISQVDLAFATGTLLGADRVTWAPVDPRKPRNTHSPRVEHKKNGSPSAQYMQGD